MCGMHVVCESGGSIHTFLHLPVCICSGSVPRFSGKLIFKNIIFYFIFYSLVRLLQSQKFQLGFLGGLTFKNNIHDTVKLLQVRTMVVDVAG